MQTLMAHNLIDEYRIWVHPIVLGSGTRLFTDRGVRTTLRLAGARTLQSGVAILTYAPANQT